MADAALHSTPVDGRHTWYWAGAAVAGYWAVVLWLFRDTARGIEDIWARSDTFAHGYLILPIAAWLVYRQRAALRVLVPAPSAVGLLLMVPVALLWLAAFLVDVNVVSQLALVALLVTGTWAILGTQVVRWIAFPLGFLFLAVPVGEGLIPPLQEFTAFATVRMVELSGVPVYREGMFFSLPSGNWRVVEACSGVRYLIASFTLGVLYAYLNYTHWGKRALFAVVSLLLPIVANALRAYLIVMLGHVSNGELAAGVDHLIYGWVFFGVVMLLLFWVGSFWMDPPAPAPIPRVGVASGGATPAGLLLTGLLAVAIAWSPWWLVAGRFPVGGAAQGVAAVEGAAGAAIDWPWEPRSDGADRIVRSVHAGADRQLYFEIQQFPPVPGVEAAVHFRELNPASSQREVRDLRSRQVQAGNRTLTVQEAQITDQGQRMRIWYWYRIGDFSTGSATLVKVLELWQRLLPNGQGTERLVLVAPDDEAGSAVAVMQRFIAAQEGG
ncbi:exosortase A [Parahaliea aestuarii]|uniref:exosortase A n=1 Tax=Parahaliea aestuarii TaxID=1852021 RepID=UPI00164F8C02|nr:exosortase A [Parahaliea aestuarii]